MDVRDMGFFLDDSFDSVIDKGIDLSLPFIWFRYHSNIKQVSSIYSTQGFHFPDFTKPSDLL